MISEQEALKKLKKLNKQAVEAQRLCNHSITEDDYEHANIKPEEAEFYARMLIQAGRRFLDFMGLEDKSDEYEWVPGVTNDKKTLTKEQTLTKKRNSTEAKELREYKRNYAWWLNGGKD